MFLEGETMSKPLDCLDWVSFWRKAPAAVLLIIFAAAVSPCRASESDFTDQFGVSYSNFWSTVNLPAIYGYGYEKDLSSLYQLLEMLQERDSELVNPMKTMPDVILASTVSSGWDYLADDIWWKQKASTNFVGAVILLRLISFDAVVGKIAESSELRETFAAVWQEYDETAVWILLHDKSSMLGGQQFPALFRDFQGTIERNILLLQYSPDWLYVDTFAYMNPIRMDMYPRYMWWIIEEERVKEAIQ